MYNNIHPPMHKHYLWKEDVSCLHVQDGKMSLPSVLLSKVPIISNGLPK